MEKEILLRNIWSVNKVIDVFKASYPDSYSNLSSLVRQYIKKDIDSLRLGILSGQLTVLPELEIFIQNIESKINLSLSNHLKPVINATGVILNTNLGRAPLSASALNDLQKTAGYYSNLEYDSDSGKRGSRQGHLEKLIKQITGADSAFVVNNNASAVYLVCNTFAKNKEVIASRGELVEIGGSFRLPEIIEQSFATLLEVGTTNKTYISDYQKAIGANTGLLMKSHPSNYKISGFTEQATTSELVKLGKEHDVLTFEDIGSGLLIEPQLIDLEDEPYILDKVKEGPDLLCFSGDKLLGGPQAGIILGRKDLISKIKSNPLSRITRIDKLSLIALESTLKIYLYDPEFILKEIPIFKMLTLSYREIKERAFFVLESLKGAKAELAIVDSFSKIGGGSSPDISLITPVLSILPKNKSLELFASELRANTIPVIGKIEKNKFLINLRTVFDEQVPELINILKNVVQ